MRGSGGGRAEETTVREGVAPGRLTALLEEIAAAPDAELGDEWERALRPGDAIGKFELVRDVGRGGFGIVWEARDRELGRVVAFKAVRAGRRDALREERLLAEAEALRARLAAAPGRPRRRPRRRPPRHIASAAEGISSSTRLV